MYRYIMFRAFYQNKRDGKLLMVTLPWFTSQKFLIDMSVGNNKLICYRKTFIKDVNMKNRSMYDPIYIDNFPQFFRKSKSINILYFMISLESIYSEYRMYINKLLPTDSTPNFFLSYKQKFYCDVTINVKCISIICDFIYLTWFDLFCDLHW